MSEPDPTIMAPSDPRDQLRGVERRLHDAAGRLLEGDDDQHQRFARLIRERGSTVRAAQALRWRLAEQVEDDPAVARAMAEQILGR